MEKNQTQGVLSLFLVVLTVLLVYSVFWGPLSDLGPSYPSRTVAVSASGKAIAKPDVALISFSVVTEGANTQTVTDENNTKVNKVIAYLKEQGIKDEDIKTTEYNLSPVYTQQSYPYSGTYVPTIAKYSLTQSVQAKVRDFSKVSPLMGGIVSMGVNRLNNVSFTIDDPDKYLAEARTQAFQKAKEKADAMAKEVGFTLKKIVSVNEYGNTPSPMYEKSMMVDGRGGAASSITPPSVEPGSSEIGANVTIVYEIR